MIIWYVIVICMLCVKLKKAFTRIPKVIHKVFINHSMDLKWNTIDEHTIEAHDSWKTLNPTYEIRYYSGNDCRRYLQKHFGIKYVHVFDALKAYSNKCDFFRYCVVYREGGIYSDWKQVCLKPIDSYMPRGISWFSTWDIQQNCMINGLFGACAKHPVLKRVIDICFHNIMNQFYGANPLYTTGPVVFGEAFMKYYTSFEWGEVVNTSTVCVGGKFYKSDDNLLYIPFFDKNVVLHKHQKLEQSQEWNTGNNYNTLWNDKDLYDNNNVNKLKKPSV